VKEVLKPVIVNGKVVYNKRTSEEIRTYVLRELEQIEGV